MKTLPLLRNQGSFSMTKSPSWLSKAHLRVRWIPREIRQTPPGLVADAQSVRLGYSGARTDKGGLLQDLLGLSWVLLLGPPSGG